MLFEECWRLPSPTSLRCRARTYPREGRVLLRTDTERRHTDHALSNLAAFVDSWAGRLCCVDARLVVLHQPREQKGSAFFRVRQTRTSRAAPSLGGPASAAGLGGCTKA